MELNLPWTESLFFEEELTKRKSLSAQEEKEARFYHQEGYLLLENFLEPDLIDAAAAELQQSYAPPPNTNRELDFWRHSNAVRKLAIDDKILEKLKMLYGREPIPFQTLNFKYGSQQNAHSDSIHFHTFPERFMCGVWVALEDVDEQNGTLVYYPGSHQLNFYNLHLLSKAFEPGEDIYASHYEPFIAQLIAKKNLQPAYLTAKKGSLIIWSANLLHGGMPLKDPNRTRWSQVTHYFFENCLYYNPQKSNYIAGEWSMDKITNIRTGQRLSGNYNGKVLRQKAARNNRTMVSSSVSYNWRDLQRLWKKVYWKIKN